jgi:hypothetical protein
VNAFEFVKKAYGVGDLSRLNLYLVIKGRPDLFKVDSVGTNRVNVLQGTISKAVSSSTSLYVYHVVERRSVLKNRVLLHLERGIS